MTITSNNSNTAATVNASEGTMQTEGEAPDSADIPPHSKQTHSPTLSPSAKTLTPNMASKTPAPNNGATAPANGHPVPLPPAEAGAYEKQPGHTRNSLQKLVTAIPAATPPTPQHHQRNRSTHKPQTNGASSVNGANHLNQSSNGSSTSSPTASDSDWGSQPSTRPPSQAPSRPPSRAPSMSAGTSGGKITGLVKPLPDSTPASPITPARGKPASVHSDGGHKFTLKDLLGSGPKLVRKSSQRSASSRKSDSDYDGVNGATRSVTGESAMSLSQKYGVCQKVAIGKGATSVVRLAHKWNRDPREEKLYAVKEFRKRRKNETEKEYVKKLTAEFCISSTLHHDNVVETVDLIQDESHNWCEVMEFCPGGDLYAAIKKGGMSPSEVECCFKQLLNGIGYLHSQGVAHRDIKPENIFFDAKGKLKIGDYGASTVYRLPWEATIHMSTGLCGSEPYIAPEQFMGKREPS
ncbi:hypothetical protein AX16_009924 [Volvariella volvacea WC 439]|nr:hypothetical protein AX16_009924 [Volvariella volvacea WC 439]